jgi:hypothetical protein
MSCQKSGADGPQISSHEFHATKLEGLGFVTEAHHHRCGCDVGLENGVLNRAIGAATSAVCQAAKRIFHGSQHARISIGIIQPVEELSMMMRNKNSGEMAQSNQTKKNKYDMYLNLCKGTKPALHKCTFAQKYKNGNDSGGKPKGRGRKDDNSIQPSSDPCRTVQKKYFGC